MGVIYHNATPQEQAILSFAITTGYFTMATAQIAFPTMQYHTLYKQISKLVQKEYLDIYKIGGTGKSTPNVYKITTKAAHLFNISKSYKVRSHKDEYIAKKVLESKFIATYYEKYSSDILTEYASKMDALLSLGYEKSHIPKTIGDLVYHIEEIIVLNTQREIEWIGNHDMALVTCDDIYKNVDSQVKAIIKKYQNLVTHKPIKYLIVTDDPNRQKLWDNYLMSLKYAEEEFTDCESEVKHRNVQVEYIKLYLDYLKNFREQQYKELLQRLSLLNASTDEIIVKTSLYIKRNIITFKPKKETVTLVSALDFKEFIELIKASNVDESKEYFMTKFFIEVVPDATKVSIDNIKKEVAEKFNFSNHLI